MIHSLGRILFFSFASSFLIVCEPDAVASDKSPLVFEKSDDRIVVTSHAGPTWRAVVAVTPEASVENPGGGVIIALHIPADNPESIVGSVPRHFAFGPLGLDNLEWRYKPKERKWGIRNCMGTGGVIESLAIAESRESEEIVVNLSGHWENVPRFEKQIVFNPNGCKVKVAADWDGPDSHYGMWWIWSQFRGKNMDNQNVRIWDAANDPVPLPVRKENVYRIPEGIDIPYEVAFPLMETPATELRLKINEFGGFTSRGPCYELWPEAVAKKATDPEDTYKVFMPRWISNGIEKREYVFEYEWTVVE